jgi:hypothetical protein
MSSADAVAGVLWIGATLYAVFGGADFGAGLWALLSGRSERGRRARALVDWAIGPVWEANHVWLIFALVVLWTGFSVAFGAVMSTLFIPLSLAALGIVLRGSGFAFHKLARRGQYRRLAERLFGLFSLLTPFFMGTAVGAIASGRVPVGNAAGDPVTSWLNGVSLLTGALFVATSAYLAAVFLITDARRAGDPDLERYFADRALIAALVAGAIALAGLFVYRAARNRVGGLRARGAGAFVAGRAPRDAAARDRRGGARHLGLGGCPAPVLAPRIADDRRRRRRRRDAHRDPHRVRRGGGGCAAGAGVPLHARPAERGRGRGPDSHHGATASGALMTLGRV